MITRKQIMDILREEDDAKRKLLIAALPKKDLEALEREVESLREEVRNLRSSNPN